VAVYFTSRGTEELGERRGGDEVKLGGLAARLPAFVDLHTEPARADDEDREP
jgi:hypothetical protein